MATDQQFDAAGGGGGGVDRITALPDDVLHMILARLPTTDDAACTSVLSRRWRRVWTGVPALSFRYDESPSSSSAQQQDQLDRVDAALSVHAATTTTVERLEIAVPYGVPDARVARWLRFASRRLSGELRLVALPSKTMSWDEAKEATIPLCEGITSMSLCLGRKLQFPLQSTGAFTALAALELTTGSVSGGELEFILSSRCPQLKRLALEVVTITLRPAAGDNRALCIRSDSLEQLKIIANIYRHDLLQVATPELKSLFLNVHCNLHIIAPKLSKLYWHCNSYDPDRHRLEEVPRHLRRLRVAINTPLVAMMRRFDTVHELHLFVSIPEGSEYYNRFLQDINHLIKCEVLVLTYSVTKHAFKLTMLNILAKCAGLRKLVIDHPVYITDKHSCDWWPEPEWNCQCEWPKILKIDNTAMCLLEQVEIMDNSGYTWSNAAFVERLSACIGHFGKTAPITIIENYEDV